MHRRRLLPAVVVAALGGLLATGLAGTALLAGPASGAVEPVPGLRISGADISWPNCPKGMGIPSRRSPGNPLPLASAKFVVIGLTNGPGWHPNPCLTRHVTWAKAHGLWTSAYSMTTFPNRRQRAKFGPIGPWTPDTRRARLRNAGYQQARFNIASMKRVELEVPFVWVDVEPYPTHPWSRHRWANRAVVNGVVRAYEDRGLRVGFYSYDGGWRTVVGGWRKPNYPAWVPVGPERFGWTVASRACRRPSFSGGPVMLAQWVDGRRDRDVTCGRLTGRAGATATAIPTPSPTLTFAGSATPEPSASVSAEVSATATPSPDLFASTPAAIGGRPNRLPEFFTAY